MFFTYLGRELIGRRRQTTIVAIGMAIAIALVVIVNSVAVGVQAAQASVLSSIYGVGTDITVAAPAAAPGEDGGPGRFEFGADDGATADGSTTVSQSRLGTGFGTGTMDAATLDTVLATDGVADATAVLALSNTTFNGEMPDRSQMGQPGDAPADGGADGAGGSAFDVDSYSVLGVDPGATSVGPLSAVSLVDGRLLDSGDAGATVAVLDSAYATSAELAVGDTIDAGGTSLEIVGLVTSATSDAATAANVYLPLDVAQSIAGLEGVVSTIYVSASSAAGVDALQADLETALPDETVNTQADLAASVSGSLSTAADLLSKLGLWLSIGVLAAAFLIAILFTVSGVTRRTREFGTLKAIGWSNGRITRQVAGESIVQGLLGGALGVALGVASVLVINALGLTLSGSAAATATDLPGVPGGGTPPGIVGATAAATDVVIQAPLTVSVMLVAVALSVLGGVLAGAFGGWRAASLRPSAALRSVA